LLFTKFFSILATSFNPNPLKTNTMAKLTGLLSFTGKLQGISAHKRKGTDAIIIKPRYGPSKNDIDTKPSYANTRRVNKEFGGRSTASKWIRDGYHALKKILDPDNLGRLNALLQAIQVLDKNSEYGKRAVALSLNRDLLAGFNLNKWHHFESTVQHPIHTTITRELLKAIVSMPALLPGANFFPPGQHPFFRIVATLNIVPDLYHHQPKYRPRASYEGMHPQVAKTEWMAVNAGSEAISLELQLPEAPPNDEFSLVLTLGMELGTPQSTGLIQAVKYAGCGKILAVR
jgi:hypothetical protein